ncbi:phosphatase PAP2 family protein [Sphingomonas sp. GCM10030256]|uniref:phosphatase PAP2 family protein n=1 Tax=Sphingomonas sp. GCM10030256 TaxID=3273427 RepID=UPI003607C968
MTDRQLPEIEDPNLLERADAAVADVFIPYAEQPVVQAIGEVSDLSDQEPLYAASAAVIAVGLAMRDSRTVQAGTRILASHLLATALRGIVKHLVDRTRPEAAARKGEYEAGEGKRFESDYNSFPSGHTSGAVAVALAVGRAYPDSAPAALGIAGAAAAAQIGRSKHFVSDVVAGVGIGIVAEAIVNGVVARAARS